MQACKTRSNDANVHTHCLLHRSIDCSSPISTYILQHAWKKRGEARTYTNCVGSAGQAPCQSSGIVAHLQRHQTQGDGQCHKPANSKAEPQCSRKSRYTIWQTNPRTEPRDQKGRHDPHTIPTSGSDAMDMLRRSQ